MLSHITQKHLVWGSKSNVCTLQGCQPHRAQGNPRPSCSFLFQRNLPNRSSGVQLARLRPLQIASSSFAPHTSYLAIATSSTSSSSDSPSSPTSASEPILQEQRRAQLMKFVANNQERWLRESTEGEEEEKTEEVRSKEDSSSSSRSVLQAGVSWMKQLEARLNKEDLSGCVKLLSEVEETRRPALRRQLKWRHIDMLMELCARRGSAKKGAYIAQLKGTKFELSALNTLMGKFAKHGKLKCALRLLILMEKNDRTKPDEYTCLHLVEACAEKQRPNKAVEIVRYMQSAWNIRPNTYIYNATLNSASQDFNFALQVFGEMRREHVPPDTVTYNTMLKICTNVGELEHLHSIRDHMQESGVKADVVTYSTLMSACTKTTPPKVEEAFGLLVEMQNKGLTPNVVTWCTLMHACCLAGQVESTFTVLDLMQEAKCKPNRHVYNLLIGACNNASQWERSDKVFKQMIEQGVEPDVLTWNAVMKARSQIAEEPVEGALECLVASMQAGVVPTVQTWGVLIDICAVEGDVEHALRAFDLMHNSGIRPDISAYTSLMKAYIAGENLEGALQLYRMLKQDPPAVGRGVSGVKGQQQQQQGAGWEGPLYGMLITACLQGCPPHVEGALEVYRGMRAAGLAPSNRLFRSLLDLWVERGLSDPAAPEGEDLNPFLCTLAEETETGDPKMCIDLHGLSTVEARACVLCLLRAHVQAFANTHKPPNHDLVIITGAGHNSSNGVPLVRQAVLKLLEEVNLAPREKLSQDNSSGDSGSTSSGTSDEGVNSLPANKGRVVVHHEDFVQWLQRSTNNKMEETIESLPDELPPFKSPDDDERVGGVGFRKFDLSSFEAQ